MGNILALLNILFIGDLQNDELVKLFDFSIATSSVDRVELLGQINDRIKYLYREITIGEVSSISSNSKVIGKSHWLVGKEVYRILSNMEVETLDNPNCLPVANIVLVGTPSNPVFLSLIHLVNQMIKSHNSLGHPTKVQLIVTNLQEIAVI